MCVYAPISNLHICVPGLKLNQALQNQSACWACAHVMHTVGPPPGYAVWQEWQNLLHRLSNLLQGKAVPIYVCNTALYLAIKFSFKDVLLKGFSANM